jgi:hypothetical protein
MLTLNKKIDYFEQYLLNCNGFMEEELHIYFFELENGSFDFLNQLNSKPEIEDKIDYLVRMMLKHDHEDGLHNIIENYL